MWIQPHDSCADFSYLNEVLDVDARPGIPRDDGCWQ